MIFTRDDDWKEVKVGRIFKSSDCIDPNGNASWIKHSQYLAYFALVGVLRSTAVAGCYHLQHAALPYFPETNKRCKLIKFLTFICMSEITFNYYPQFFTATILEWKHLLSNDVMKDIIISSLKFLANEGRVKVYGFVLMPNHIHIICLSRHFCGGKYRMDMKRQKCSKAF